MRAGAPSEEGTDMHRPYSTTPWCRRKPSGGRLTDPCVESAVRDPCDLGHLVTLVTDATATHTPERHAASLAAIGGYDRQRTADEIIAELAQHRCRA